MALREFHLEWTTETRVTWRNRIGGYADRLPRFDSGGRFVLEFCQIGEAWVLANV